jgi:hypothetical protein
MHVGEPLAAFRGVLSGIPEYEGRDEPLMQRSSNDAPTSRGRRRNA